MLIISSTDFSPNGEEGTSSPADLKINVGGESNEDISIRSNQDASLSIQDLSNDLLLGIFRLNADMEQDTWIDSRDRFGSSRAINTTRLSSQACRAWRELILGSSSLWGRLFDLDYFHVRREWRDEVMTRSGVSALCIQGRLVEGTDRDHTSFFVSLLDRHWARIERLDVEVNHTDFIPTNAWEVFRRPSETIQKFHFTFYSAAPVISTVNDAGFLFSDHAPGLRDFQCYSVYLNLHAPWLSNNMRRLDVSSPYGRNLLTITEWLDILRKMPSLEYLSLHRVFSEEDRTASQKALRLPNLEEINLSGNILQASIFLEHLTPHAGCYPRLYWRTDDVEIPPHPTELRLVGQVISNYAQRWFSNHVARGLGFSITFNSFDVHQYPSPPRLLPIFWVNISFTRAQHFPAILTLLNSFSLCGFEKITTLRIFTDLAPFQKLDSNVPSFFMLLSAVDTLVINAEGLKALLLLQDCVATSEEERLFHLSHPFFPLLKTIRLERMRDMFDAMQLRDHIGVFFGWRNEVNCPIQILDLTECEDLVEVDALEDGSGLKVIWDNFEEGVGEYTFFKELPSLKVIWEDHEGLKEYICSNSESPDF